MKTTRLLAIIIGIVAGGALFFVGHKAPPPGATPKIVRKIEVTSTVAPTPRLTKKAPVYTPPTHIKIPKIGVDALVEKVGEDSNGRMDVPKGIDNTGWFDLGYKPGETGSAVIAAHYDTPTGSPGVFYKLGDMQDGDLIYVTDEHDKTLTFKVVDKQTHKDATFPIKDVFAKNDKQRLNLITCSGSWDKNAKNYSDRLVVYAVLQ